MPSSGKLSPKRIDCAVLKRLYSALFLFHGLGGLRYGEASAKAQANHLALSVGHLFHGASHVIHGQTHYHKVVWGVIQQRESFVQFGGGTAAATPEMINDLVMSDAEEPGGEGNAFGLERVQLFEGLEKYVSRQVFRLCRIADANQGIPVDPVEVLFVDTREGRMVPSLRLKDQRLI